MKQISTLAADIHLLFIRKSYRYDSMYKKLTVQWSTCCHIILFLMKIISPPIHGNIVKDIRKDHWIGEDMTGMERRNKFPLCRSYPRS